MLPKECYHLADRITIGLYVWQHDVLCVFIVYACIATCRSIVYWAENGNMPVSISEHYNYGNMPFHIYQYWAEMATCRSVLVDSIWQGNMPFHIHVLLLGVYANIPFHMY